MLKHIKNKKGQAATEYILTTAFLFGVLVSFYVAYSNIIPTQFERGAKLILTVYSESLN